MLRPSSLAARTCFFAISGVLPRETAIAKIKEAIERTYSKRGREIVERNFAAVDKAVEHLFEVPIPDHMPETWPRPPIVSKEAPEFVQKVTVVRGLPSVTLGPAGTGGRILVSTDYERSAAA